MEKQTSLTLSKGVLQGDTLAPYLFIICLDYVLKMSIDLLKENGFGKDKKQVILFTNHYGQGLHWWHSASGKYTHPSQIPAALSGEGIGLHVDADKTEYICFNQNQKGGISTLKGGSLKLGVKFTYLGSSISSTESNINMCLAKAWIAIDRLSINHLVVRPVW